VAADQKDLSQILTAIVEEVETERLKPMVSLFDCIAFTKDISHS
jgi:hypothetical protein